MKSNIGLNKFLPIANLLAIAIVIYFSYTFFFSNKTSIETSNLSPIPSNTNSDVNQESPNSLNTKLLLSNNIFKTPDTSVRVPASQTPKIQPALNTQRQLDFRLLGTVAGNKEVACAIIEDLKTKVQDMYKTGDMIQGVRIEKIERNRIILLDQGIQRVVNLYVASDIKPETSDTTSETTQVASVNNIPDENVIKVTSPTEREVNKKAFLAKIGGIEAILKTVEITPNIVDGKADGLKISGLDGLSMAKFVGLQNGDIIHVLNGQVITDNRKAFQVLRKARSLPSLDLELSRGSETKTLSFKID